MNCGLNKLFALMAEDCGVDAADTFMAAGPGCQPDLFAAKAPFWSSPRDIGIIAGLYSAEGLDMSVLSEPARRLFELSVNAFDAVIHAWMSGLSLQAEAIRYGRKILGAGERTAADAAASDRGNPDARAVLEAAYRVRHEIDRLQGFLRFSPGRDGLYIARCEPDYFVLPSLGEHFFRRFGDTPWIIIDEKRRFCVHCLTGKAPVSGRVDEFGASLTGPQNSSNEWEELWRLYHKTINNESRNNPDLQRKFMPKRYRKYLPECD
jgi:probable DNA metabolism protein